MVRGGEEWVEEGEKLEEEFGQRNKVRKPSKQAKATLETPLKCSF